MNDTDYMRRAIELAKLGCGFTNPNPMVGAVIVKDGRIIGEGYHEKCGELHAERNAFKHLTENAAGATIYVTLEPCCHYGKTPPCTEAIIENKISRVVIGSRDPNPLVSGKGAKLLREHGIEVVEDFLREECDELNPVFFHYITTKKPYIVLKYAMTMDGKIATKTGASKWITGEAARSEVQKMRHRYSAILAGIGTVLADDPMLNCREEGLKSPIRIIVDSHLRIPMDSNIVKTANELKTYVAYSSSDPTKEALLKNAGVELLHLPMANNCECADVSKEFISQTNASGSVDLSALFDKLGELGVDSVLVEGGGTINDSLRALGLIDRVEAFIAPKMFGGSNAKGPVWGEGIALVDQASHFSIKELKQIGEDVLITYVKKEQV